MNLIYRANIFCDCDTITVWIYTQRLSQDNPRIRELTPDVADSLARTGSVHISWSCLFHPPTTPTTHKHMHVQQTYQPSITTPGRGHSGKGGSSYLATLDQTYVDNLENQYLPTNTAFIEYKNNIDYILNRLENEPPLEEEITLPSEQID